MDTKVKHMSQHVSKDQYILRSLSKIRRKIWEHYVVTLRSSTVDPGGFVDQLCLIELEADSAHSRPSRYLQDAAIAARIAVIGDGSKIYTLL